MGTRYAAHFDNHSNAIQHESWLLENGAAHRLGGPAYIEYYRNGNIKREDYYINGVMHRVDGPAITMYKEDGSVECEIWFWKDCKYLIEDLVEYISLPEAEKVALKLMS